jgi:AcrR family transcriptional regulator
MSKKADVASTRSPGSTEDELAAANARIAKLEAELKALRRQLNQKESRTQSPSADRRAEIISVAGRLFAERGYFNTTIRDIAEEVGILSGSLYHYFSSKEDMVYEILSEHYRVLLEESREAVAVSHPSEALRRLVSAIFRVVEKDWVAPTILRNEHQQLRQLPRFSFINDVGKEFDKMWFDVITEGQRQGEVRNDVEPPVLYRFIRDSISGWYQPVGTRKLSEIADLYNVLIFEGIAQPA